MDQHQAGDDAVLGQLGRESRAAVARRVDSRRRSARSPSPYISIDGRDELLGGSRATESRELVELAALERSTRRARAGAGPGAVGVAVRRVPVAAQHIPVGVCITLRTLPPPVYMCTPHGRHGSKLRTARMMSTPLKFSGPFSSKIGVFCTASS